MSAGQTVQFENYVEAQPTLLPTPARGRVQNWILEQIPPKKSPRPVHCKDVFWERANKEVLGNHATEGLDDAYVLEDRRTVVQFIQEHRLHGILVEARRPLKEAFTDKTVKTLRLVRDDEGFETLFCLVMITGDMHAARQALRRFDRQWWLARSKQIAGRLNFDFELV